MDGNYDGVDNPDDVDGNVVNVEDDSLDGELVVGGCVGQHAAQKKQYLCAKQKQQQQH